MTVETEASPLPPALLPEKATALALRLAHAEHALLALTSGQVDAIINPGGHTYLLRPAQEHLRQSEIRLRAILESSADVIAVISRGGMILSQSLAARHVLGQPPGDLIGKLFFDFIHQDDWPAVHAVFLNVIEDFIESGTVSFRHLAQDGAWRRLDASMGKIRDAASPRVVVTLRASPTPRPARLEPLQSSADVPAPVAGDRLIAMLSHELRTPLSPALFGIQELLEDERFLDARPLLTMIRRNLDLQARLLEELTDFTTVGQHKVRLRLEPIDVHEAIGFVLEICRSELAAAQIEVLLYLRAEEMIAQADAARLQQVLWNLVKNAVKFSTPGSSISIATSNDTPGRLTIEVADHGIGIEPDLLPLVFDPFKQGQPLHQLYGGLGLGLFIAKGLAEAQGGTLTVASKGRGQGTAFCLSLKTSLPSEVAEKVISLGLSHPRAPGVGLS